VIAAGASVEMIVNVTFRARRRPWRPENPPIGATVAVAVM